MRSSIFSILAAFTPPGLQSADQLISLHSLFRQTAIMHLGFHLALLPSLKTKHGDNSTRVEENRHPPIIWYYHRNTIVLLKLVSIKPVAQSHLLHNTFVAHMHKFPTSCPTLGRTTNVCPFPAEWVTIQMLWAPQWEGIDHAQEFQHMPPPQGICSSCWVGSHRPLMM
jgi:hypothetical protein